MSKKKVFAAGLIHESHAFSKLPTTLENFKSEMLAVGEEEILAKNKGTRTEYGGFIDVAEQFGWEMVHSVVGFAGPSGLLTKETLEFFIRRMEEDLRKAMPVDGLMLMLHGSIGAEGVPDAEGEILRRLRAIAGPDIPIAVTLDLHANVSNEMIRHANLITSYRTTPHIDMYETGERGARLLQQVMDGNIQPKLYLARRPMIGGLDLGRTVDPNGPMVRLLNMARQYEKDVGGVLDISVHAGYSYADFPEIGPSVVVVGDGENAIYQEIAEKLMDYAWEIRAESTITMLSIDEMKESVKRDPGGKGPLIVVDYTDGVYGGAYGDATNVLKGLLEADVPGTVFGPLWDPELVKEGTAKGVGAVITADVGGKCDPAFGGGPLRLTGTIEAVSDGKYIRKGPYRTGSEGSMGPSILIHLGNVRLIVCTNRVQPEDREQFRIFGIHPEEVNIIGFKGVNHFRADFEPIARGLLFVEGGGLVSTDLRVFSYQHVRRPAWPLDEIEI